MITSVKERVASTFVSKEREGRIFLAGDAAHVHAVNGGQGLNTGLADAFNLIWRIAFAAKGLGGAALLKSYDEERRITAEGVIDVAAKLVRSTVKTALEYVDLIEKSAKFITGNRFWLHFWWISADMSLFRNGNFVFSIECLGQGLILC